MNNLDSMHPALTIKSFSQYGFVPFLMLCKYYDIHLLLFQT